MLDWWETQFQSSVGLPLSQPQVLGYNTEWYPRVYRIPCPWYQSTLVTADSLWVTAHKSPKVPYRWEAPFGSAPSWLKDFCREAPRLRSCLLRGATEPWLPGRTCHLQDADNEDTSPSQQCRLPFPWLMLLLPPVPTSQHPG